MTVHRHLSRLILLCGLVPVAARADHLPAGQQATGKPETTLAGISITRHGSASQVLRRLGPPTEQKTAPNNPVWIGYRWILKNARIEVGVAGDAISSVYVELTGPGPALGTGAGLKLGDDLKRLKAIYGRRFQEHTYPDMQLGSARGRSERVPHSGVWENHRVTIQWRSPEYALVAGFDEHGRIASLWLLRPECFPGECG